MPRPPRVLSESGCYHVMLRGTGKRLIFETDDDRLEFLAQAGRAFAKWNVDVLAWCLMSNHVHLLVRDSDRELSSAMRSLASSYASYFNRETGHVGHVFGGRFGSKPIESDEQLLAVLLYIHDNPAAAGICAAGEYRWSSYQDYAGIRTSELLPLNRTVVLGLLDGEATFERFHGTAGHGSLCPGHGGRLTEEEALRAARLAAAPRDLAEIGSLALEERNAALVAMRGAGLSYRQIERVTGVGRKVVARVCSRA